MHIQRRGPEDAQGWNSARQDVSTEPNVARSTSDIHRREMGMRDVSLIVVAGVLIAALAVTAAAVTIIKRRQKRRQLQKGSVDETQTKTSGVAKFLQFWKPNSGRYQQAAGEDSSDQNHALNDTSSRRNRNGATNQAGGNAATIDRNTSVRSVLTLPAYMPTAAMNERVLGREGERDGIDVIVDLPTAEEEEALRDEEMEAMYQIRVARRQQNAERDERRRERQEAVRRHDSETLARIRAQARAAGNDTTLTDLRQNVERIKETRQRSASSVSYGDLGVARHDGTRIRANSNETERMGLLSDAASIALSTRSGEPSPTFHRRLASNSSFVSVNSDHSSPDLTRPRASSRVGSQPNTPRLGSGGPHAGSSPELVEADLGDESVAPPTYEDVSLDDDNDSGSSYAHVSSTTTHDEPPPDYPGPHRSSSQRTVGQETGADNNPRNSRGVGGVPQLPSLRISRLPEIVVEPSSARPRD